MFPGQVQERSCEFGVGLMPMLLGWTVGFLAHNPVPSKSESADAASRQGGRMFRRPIYAATCFPMAWEAI